MLFLTRLLRDKLEEEGDVQGEGSALLERLESEKSGWQRERLLAWKRVREGEESQSVADQLGAKSGDRSELEQ